VKAQVILRAAAPLDAGRLGEILYRFQQDTPWMPKLYAEVEAISFCGTMIDRGWVTVAIVDGVIAGFLARDHDEVCALYLAVECRGQGIGARLLVAAQEASPAGLRLAAFAANHGARQFYVRHGFCELTTGDGSGNEEGLPDIKMQWQPQQREVA